MSTVSLASWVAGQKQSTFHLTAVGLFGLIIFLSYQSLVGLIVGYTIFFLVTSLGRVWKMLIFMAVIGIVLAVLPFLAPLAIILMIVLFCMRIGYVIKNWKPVVSGLVVYGFAFPLFQLTADYHYWGGGMVEPLFVTAIGAAGLHFILVMLYKDGYGTKTALGIMGSVPLVILAFILPFLKLHIPMADTVVLEGAAPIDGATASHTGSSSSSVSESTIVHPNKMVSDPIVGKMNGQSVAEPVFVRPNPSPLNESMNMKAGLSTGVHPATVQHSNSFPVVAGMKQASVLPAQVNPVEWQQDDVYHVQDNIFGGKEITDSNGDKILSTKENIFKGEDLYTPEGKRVGSTHENIFKGEDIFDQNNSKVASTQENIFGGEDVYDENNQKIASIRDNGLGTKDVYDKDGNKIASIEKG